MGRVLRAHGVHGNVVLLQLTNQPRFVAGSTFVLEDGRSVTLKRSTPYKGRFLVAFDEVRTRSEADALRGTAICVPREAVGVPPEGAVWVSDVEGLPVVDPQGRVLGTVMTVVPNPAHDILVCRDAAEREYSIPMVEAFMDQILPRATQIVVRPIPGLLPDGDGGTDFVSETYDSP